jgi:hypothetical protein
MNRLTARAPALGLELLSDRVVPSCTMTQVDDLLTIRGDSHANVVDIVDDGTTVTVTCDDGAEETFTGVTDIVVKTGSGDDTLTYTFTGALAADATRSLDVSLGNGHDTFEGTLADGAADPVTGESVASALGDGATLDVVVRGYNGHDTLSFDASATDVGTGATLSVMLGGGNGKDVIDAVYGGVLLGDLVLLVNGANGQDEVSAEATFDALPPDTTPADTTDDVSGGSADIDVLGGNGKDTLTLFTTDNSGDDGDDTTTDTSKLTDLSATVDGGRAPDLAYVSDDVEVIAAKTQK